MATSRQQELRDEISAVLIRYRRRISDRGGVVPDACLDELVAVAERDTAVQAPAKPSVPVPGPGRRQARRPVEPTGAGPID